ncbi:MAG TPA: serine hydrolase domain-containing protein [Candidatus Bathyarchaeia archaeon]|nr:serine hydrolase domain-containing protein [Candidatus Bathyarchaeia archaeon]
MGVAFSILGGLWLACLRPQLAVVPHRAPGDSGFYVASLHLVPDQAVKTDFGNELIKTIRPLIAGRGDAALLVGVLCGDTAVVCGTGTRSQGDTAVPDEHTLFEIGSLAKVFTATALQIMSDAGEVELTQPLETLLPESVSVPTYKGREITLRDLALHVSGLPRVPWNSFSVFHLLMLRAITDPYKCYTTEKTYAFLKGYHLKREPGAEFSYSNLGMGLLGHALALRSGMDYEDLIASLICKPLGMRDTAVSLSEEQRLRLAQGYVGKARICSLSLAIPGDRWSFPESLEGAGALCSTGEDLMKFMGANLGVTKGALTPHLQKGHVPQREVRRGTHIAMGWFVSDLKGLEEPILWHNGAVGGSRCFLGFSEAGRFGVVALSSSDAVDELCHEILRSLSKIYDGST